MSTRPHEETWVLDGDGDVRRVGKVASLVCMRAATGTLDSQALISAAPLIARALLSLLPHHAVITTKAEAEAVTQAQSALKAAGVPLP